MGRRRKKTLKFLKRSLPRVFSCPRCGMISMRITLHQDETSQDYIMVVACGNCKDPPTRHEYRFPVAKAEIDVYNLFVDEFVKSGG